jgi:hypothetical protein
MHKRNLWKSHLNNCKLLPSHLHKMGLVFENEFTEI